MDSELLISILVAIGLPLTIAAIVAFVPDMLKKPIDNAKESLSDAMELHKDSKTIEYQEKLLDLLKAGYTEEQAKAMLKASKKIEQMKRKP